MPPSTIAGRYLVERAVGHGGMGTVWLCRDEVLGRHVAVKEVGNLPGQSTSDLARALREARNSAALNHRNVVSVFDAVEDGDRNWLVMEYVPSRTLSQVVAEDGPLTPERAAWIGAQAADGLAAAHEHGTIHRDVKPGNILVMPDDHVKITDFGIARNDSDMRLTHSGLVTGTPAYFAPELAKGEEPSAAVDVWALGATLYAAVEGRLPYPDQTNAIALLATIAAGPPARPENAGFLAEALDRMMDRDPRTRWTMADSAHALHRLHDEHKPAPRFDTLSMGGPIAAPDPEPDPEPEVESTPAPVPPQKRGPSDEPTEATEAVDEPTEATEAVDEPTEATEAVDEPTEATEAVREPTPAPMPLAGADNAGDPRPVDTADSENRNGGARYALLAAVILLVALAAGGGYLLLDGDGGNDPTTNPRDSVTATSPPTDDTSDQGSDEGSEPEGGSEQSPSPQNTSKGEGAASSPDPAQFVKDYYAHLPGDTRTAWALLSPAMQAKVGSYGNYRGFWRTISSVTVVKATAQGNTVDVRLTYTKGGTSESENRRLQLKRTDAGLVISGDGAV